MWWGRRLFSALLLILSANGFAETTGFAFGVNAEDFSLARYRIDGEGRLRHLGHTPVHKAPSSVVVDPSGQFVVAVSSTTDRLMVFRLDKQTGAITPVPGSPFRSGTRSPFSLRFHPSGQFAYVGSRFSGVGAYSFNPKTGALSPLPGSPFPAQRRTREVTIHPTGKFLYASNGYSNSISAYRIDKNTGTLKELSASPYSAGDFGVIDYIANSMFDVPPEAGGMPHSIDMDAQGRFIFVANKAAGNVGVFEIDNTSGELTAVPGSPFFVGLNPYRSRVHPSGRFVMTALWADNKVAVHAVDRNSGRLTPVKGSPFVVNSKTPVDLTFNNDGSRVYVTNYDGNEIVLFDVDVASAALKLRESLMTRLSPWSLALAQSDMPTRAPKQTVFGSGGMAGLGFLDEAGVELKNTVAGHGDALVVAPNGRFAYSLNTVDGSISSYAIDAEKGDVALLPNGVVKAGRQPTDMTIDANGWYLYVTNSGDASLSVYYLNPENGIPEPVRGSPVPTGKRPLSVTLDAAARYAFVVNAASNNVSVYRYFTNVTPLIFEARKYGSPFAAGKEPVALAIEPTGHYAYVANAGSNNISVYHVHHKSGVMSEIPGSPFKAGKRPVGLQVNPEGGWLYVANQESSTLTIHRIEKRLGALTAGVETVALPVKPVGIWFDEVDNSILLLGKDKRRVLKYAVNNATGVVRLKSDRRLQQPVNDFAFQKSFD